ncbi:MAG: DUF4178 domain-containing protein [Deltaproteobacteria bacterium]|nr:MAG: DUF4178 domain-containing protein [Deltaproteobacteria bacterium]
MHPAPSAGSTTIHCPECGAPASLRAGTVTRVCDYCGSTLVRTDVDVELVGKVSHLLDTASPILLGAHGQYGGVPFDIVGRLQVRYARGTWNEWYLAFADGTFGWLTDAQGRFAVLRPATADTTLPSWSDLRIGAIVPVDGRRYLVVDRRAAAYGGAEGELPFVARPGVTFHAADLADDEGGMITLDFEDDPNRGPPALYRGEYVRIGALDLSPLRTFEGWSRVG